MKQLFSIEIAVDNEKELDEVDIENILEDVINFEGLDWEVISCYEDIFGREENEGITLEDIAARTKEYLDGCINPDVLGHLEPAKPKKKLWRRILDF